MESFNVEQFVSLINSDVYWYGDDYCNVPFIVDFHGVKHEYLLVDFYFGCIECLIVVDSVYDLAYQLRTLEDNSVLCLPGRKNVYWIKQDGSFTPISDITVGDISMDVFMADLYSRAESIGLIL